MTQAASSGILQTCGNTIHSGNQGVKKSSDKYYQ
jgi:hypothetical protein